MTEPDGQKDGDAGGVDRGDLGFRAAAAVVALAALLRGIEAFAKSFWLDELHTIFVARGATLGAVLERVLPDFHAPLYFVVAHALQGLPGHTIRWMSILPGLVAIVPIWAILREAGASRPARLLAGLAFAALPFQIQYGAELRPYAWLQASSAAIAWAAFTTTSHRRRFAVLAAAGAIGFYTHYLAAVPIVAAGLAALVARRRGTLGFLGIAVAGTIAFASFLPWLIYDESWIFRDPGVMTRDEKPERTAETPTEPPRSLDRRKLIDDVAATPARMLAPMGASLGGIGGKAMRLLFAIVLVHLLVGGTSWFVRARSSERRLIAGVLLLAAATASLITFAAVVLWSRVPIQYFAPMTWIWPLAIGLGVDGYRSLFIRRFAGALILAALALAAFAQLTGRPREDLRKAVEIASARAGRHTAIMRQPAHYDHALVYSVYGARVEVREPRDVPMADVPTGREAVIVIARSFHWTESEAPKSLWEPLIRGRTIAETIRVDDAVNVYVLIGR